MEEEEGGGSDMRRRRIIGKINALHFHLVLVLASIHVTILHEAAGNVTDASNRMLWFHYLGSLFLTLYLFGGSHALEKKDLATSLEEPTEQIRSPMLEVLMHLPSNFRDVNSFTNTLGIKPEKVNSKREITSRWKRNEKPRRLVDVRTYEIAQPVSGNDRVNSRNRGAEVKRWKRETEDTETTKAILEKPEPDKSTFPSVREKFQVPKPEDLLPLPDAIRGPIYTSYPVKEFDIIDIDDPDDPRRRKNDSADGQEDNSQRDKRTFTEGGDNGEATTSLPFWKRKKENPPFITGRGGSAQKGNSYSPPQHRSGENARESHSIKNLDETLQSNEISRSNQDNYYSSTNRRAYSRHSDNATPSTPKSVYDTLDYNNSKKNQEPGRNGFNRNYDEKKETLRDARQPTHEQYYNRPVYYNPPGMYDRVYYQPPYPYPTEVVGRGVEYYHRTYDPSTGRIIYYANMPEHGRSFDYRFMDPVNRNLYVNNRPYLYDPYYRNYVPPPPPPPPPQPFPSYDYRFSSGFGRSTDYLRTGRSSSQAYSYPYQDKDKFVRDARFVGAYDKSNRLKDDVRNKTYIIYDAEENRSQFSRNQQASDPNRLVFTPGPNNLPLPQPSYKQPPPAYPSPADYFPPAAFPFRNQFYQGPQGPFWNVNQRSGASGVTDSNFSSRPLNSPEVQLPLTVSNWNRRPSGELDKKS